MSDKDENDEKDHFQINTWFIDLRLSGATLDKFLPWLGYALIILSLGITIVWIIKSWRGENVELIPDPACVVYLVADRGDGGGGGREHLPTLVLRQATQHACSQDVLPIVRLPDRGQLAV